MTRLVKCKICKESEKVKKIKYIGNVCSDCIPKLYELIERADNDLFNEYIYPGISEVIIKKLDQGILSDWLIAQTKINDVSAIFLVIDEMMFSDDVSPEIKDKLVTLFEKTYEEMEVE